MIPSPKETFLQRWARRKQSAEHTLAKPPPSPNGRALGDSQHSSDLAPLSDIPSAEEKNQDQHNPYPPSMGDKPPLSSSSGAETFPSNHKTVEALTEQLPNLSPQSDFSPFMQSQVPSDLRNAALKKLFSDPHFNVMDGLDIYIDDYTKEDPIPLSMLKGLAQSAMLGLFPEENKPEQATPAEPPSISTATLSPSASPSAPSSSTPLSSSTPNASDTTYSNPLPAPNPILAELPSPENDSGDTYQEGGEPIKEAPQKYDEATNTLSL